MEVRDSQLVRRCRVTDYSALSGTQVSCDVGSWSLTVPLRSEAARALEVGGGIVLSADNAAPGDPAVLSGRCVKLVETNTGRPGGSSLTASGVTDEEVLRMRLALPQTRAHDVADYWDESGPLELVLRDLVDVNVGPAAPSERRYPELDVPAGALRGPGTRMRPDRYSTLLAALQDAVVGSRYALTFRVVQVGGRLEFRVVAPRDLSRLVVLGFDRGNLRSYTLTQTDATVTHPYACGTGDLAARLVVESDLTPGGDPRQRRESFLDLNNESDPLVLAAKAEQATIDGAASSGVEIVTSNLGREGVYGVDFALDDRISFRSAEGSVFSDRVAKVDLRMDSGRPTWTPTVASDGASLTGLRIIDAVRQLGRKIDRLSLGR